MCIISRVFSATELKALDKKKQAILQKYGKKLVDTSPEIRNMIKKDPKIRRKLKTLLRAKHQELAGK